MNVRLLNVKYSPNVGDGLLVECLEAHLNSIDGIGPASSIDLAGRASYDHATTRRETMMWILESVPNGIRSSLARAGLATKLALGLKEHYRRELAGSCAVVVGGGNLLSDRDLNFPMKIAAALTEATRAKARLAIFGCGVSSDWSVAGLKMFRAVLEANRPVHVAVRDEASKKAWNMLFAGAARMGAVVVSDPGVLASAIYRFDEPTEKPVRPVVAIGLMSAVAIQYHGFTSMSGNDLARWYMALIDELVEGGFDISLFTNGSPEDQRFALRIWQMLSQRRAIANIKMEWVRLPIHLCRVVASADVVIAFRMHALIAAFSYGTPIVALKWDPKVDAFIHSVSLADCVVDSNFSNPEATSKIVKAAWKQGIDQSKLDLVISEAKNGINQLASLLSFS